MAPFLLPPLQSDLYTPRNRVKAWGVSQALYEIGVDDVPRTRRLFLGKEVFFQMNYIHERSVHTCRFYGPRT